MAKEESVLLAQITTLHRNLERVEKLLTKDLERVYNQRIDDLRRVQEALTGNDKDAQKTALEVLECVKRKLLTTQKVLYRPPVSGKFLRVINPPKKALANLKTRVEGKALTQAELEQAWKDYLSNKQKVQQAFNQCLEYLGGIAIRTWELDENICVLAESLVRQYVNLGVSWGSVTIVGEERLFDDVAQTTQIIRLRFPEWDIWSLPFIAYEFGRWMAGEKSELVEGLREFYTDEKGRMLRLITIGDEATLIAVGDATEEEIKDLAPKIKDLRRDCQEHKRTAEEIGRIVDQQEPHMRELFANAFATYFLGPAYPYARVCLRLDATEALQDHSNELPLACCMDLMMQLLTEMNDVAKAKTGDQYAHGPYNSEIERLKDLWEKTIEALRPDYKAKFHFGHPYDLWFKKMHDMLRDTYGDSGFTGNDWQAAEKLSGLLLSGDDAAIDPSTSLPIILNAAWHCRMRNADNIAGIEKNAHQAMQAVSETSPSLAQQGTRTFTGFESVSGR